MKKLSRFALVLGACALTLLADDFWQKKPYTQWSDKEAIRLLQNSPWAHQVSVSLGDSGRSQSGSGGGRKNRGGDGMGDATPGELAKPNLNGPNGGSRGGPTSLDQIGVSSSVLLTVCWQSALPVREATIITKLGPDKASSEQATKFLSQKMPGYVVGVLGLPATLANISPARLNEIAKTATALKIHDKDPIPAVRVQALPREQLIDLYFVFPDTSAITLDDKEVEFDANLGRMDIRRKFKLKEMVVGDKLEL